MKTFISVLTLTLSCFFFNQQLKAQAATDNTEMVIVEYMKVKPGMLEKYRDCEAVWKLIHQERVKAGYITGWELEEVLFPSGTDAEYDFLTITHLKNWKSMDDLNNTWTDETWAKLTKNLTAEQKELADDAENYRDLVKREIWSAIDMVFPAGGKMPLYRVENFMKIPDGGWDAWVDMESKFVKPVHKKSVELGTRAGWLMGYMVVPRGAEYSYNVSTIDFYNSWDQMGNDEEKAWEGTYPDMTDGQIGSIINDSRALVKSEVRMLVDSVE